ncbi:MAG: ABC transporter substrate-binding protein [Novosphingobium sp.]
MAVSSVMFEVRRPKVPLGLCFVGALAALSSAYILSCSRPVPASPALASPPATTASKEFPQLAFDQSLHDRLPKEILERNVVRVSTTAYTPPLVFYAADNRQIIGIDADIIRALEVLYGVKFEMTDLGNFAAIVPTLRAKRFDMSIGGFYDTVRAEQQVDLVNFLRDGMVIMVKRGNPHGIHSVEDLCGKTVAVTMATPTEDVVLEQAKSCANPIHVMSMPKMTDVQLALRTGRAAAIVGGYCTGVYTTTRQIGNGAGLEAIQNAKMGEGLLGIVFAKNNDQLRDAIQLGLQRLIDTGAYQAILKKWGVTPLAIQKATINNAAGDKL